jgi:polysaccharide biosynthesis transport protein
MAAFRERRGEREVLPGELVRRPLESNQIGFTRRSWPIVSDPIPEDLAVQDDEGVLLEYWQILRRRRRTIALSALGGLIGAVLLSLPQTPIYRARTSVEIQNLNGDYLNTKLVNPVADDSTGATLLTDVQTQIDVIQSEALVQRTIKKLKAEGEFPDTRKKPGVVSTVIHNAIASAEKLLRLPPRRNDPGYTETQTALKNLTARQMGQTRIIEIFYKSPDPALAENFVNTLASEYVQSNMEARWEMSDRTGEWLSGQLAGMRTKLEQSENTLQDYARRSGLLFTNGQSENGEKSNVSEEKLRQVQEELSKAEADRVAAQSHYEIAKSAPPDTLADVLNDDVLRDLQEKLTDLRQQRASLSTIYTPKHELVRRVEAQIAPLQQAFDRERAAILERIRNDYDTALRRENLLRADFNGQSAVVTDLANKSIHYNVLKREVDSNRQLYESMLQEVKQATIASGIRASNIRLVDRAQMPPAPYSPDLLLNAALGLVVGLFFGTAYSILHERNDRRLQEPGDVQLWTKLLELGTIPTAGGGRGVSTKLLRWSNSSGKVELVTQHKRQSAMAESFRTILASIVFSGDEESRPRSLVLTSASPQEGKTTIVSNLGITMAEIYPSVLLVDADLRKPRLHEVFGLKNSRGLSTLLAGIHLNGESEEMIQQTSIPGLHVIPSGPVTHIPSNLLHSPRLNDLLELWKRQFDIVLIDTPPMLQMSDARIIGRLTDAVILVSRAGRTTREAAQLAYQKFLEDRTRVLGTILNHWNPRRSRNREYHSYSKSGYHHAEFSSVYARERRP